MKIRPISARKASDVAKYNREVKRWKEGRLCACGCKKPCDDCHHMKGRVGYADIEDKEAYCSECGGTDLSYIDQYANGCEYECKECSNKFMW